MTNTPRLSLYEPVNTEIVDVLTAIDDQMLIIDSAAVVTEDTSVTRPSTSLYAGRFAYDRDTHELVRYNGAVWVRTSAENRPRGKIGFVNTSVASATVAANAEIGPILSITFVALPNRRYMISFGGAIALVAGNDAPAAYRIRKANGVTVDITSTLVATFGADANDNSANVVTRNDGFCEYTPNSGQITMGLFLARPNTGDAKTIRSVDYQYLAIEDVGTV